MPMVFPTSPVVGQVFSSGGRSWVWTGSTWDSPSAESRGVLAAGGTTGQMLTKSSNADYATQWTSRGASASGTTGFSVLGTTPTTYISINLTCSGRPVVFSYGFNHQNLNSGANRNIYARQMFEGVPFGIQTHIFSQLGVGLETNSYTFIVTPTAGVRNFSFQVWASTASACGIQDGTLTVFEI